MRILDQIVHSFEGGPIFNLVSLILGIVGVFLAFVFYFRGQRIRQPVFRTRTFHLVEEKLTKIQALKILYHDHPIENLSLTRVAIWNRGSEPIRSIDVADTDKLRITIESESKLLGAQIHSVISPTNCFSIEPDLERGIVNISFDFFQRNEGLVVDVYHTGKPKTKVVPLGTIIGGDSFVVFKNKDLVGDAFGKFVFGWTNRIKTKNAFVLFVVAISFLAIFLVSIPFLIPLMAIDKIIFIARRAPKQFLLE